MRHTQHALFEGCVSFICAASQFIHYLVENGCGVVYISIEHWCIWLPLFFGGGYIAMSVPVRNYDAVPIQGSPVEQERREYLSKWTSLRIYISVSLSYTKHIQPIPTISRISHCNPISNACIDICFSASLCDDSYRYHPGHSAAGNTPNISKHLQQNKKTHRIHTYNHLLSPV